MKKLILSAVIVLATAFAARADTIILSDNNPADVLLVAGPHPSYQGEFTLPGFVPGSMTVTSAFVEFTFFDVPFLGGSEAGIVRWDLDSSTIGTFGSFGGFFSFGDDVTGTALGGLNSSGALSYTVTITRGNVLLTNANLTATVEVPETTTTAILIGFGLMAMASLGRCQFKPVRG